MNKTKITPVLYSLPVVQTLNLPTRAEMLPKIESGEIEFLDFRARVFGTGVINKRNPYEFLETDLEALALSFEGKPFLRDHEQYEIEAREGTILASVLDNGEIVQDIRITTRRGMTDYIEGRMDRFSIGWDSEAMLCSICELDYFGGQCTHSAGRKYESPLGEKICKIVFIHPVGIETSAVNVPAVDGTHIEAQLQSLKNSILKTSDEAGQEPAEPVDNTVDNALQVQREIQKAKITSALNKSIEGEIMNPTLRELYNQRARLVERASVLSEAAESESREMDKDESAEFEAILGAGESLGSVGEIDAQISRIEDQRARLKSALEKTPAQEAIKPEAATPAAPAVLNRSEFNALSLSDQAAYMRTVKKIVE